MIAHADLVERRRAVAARLGANRLVLTPAEERVVALAAHGLTDAEVARRLGISYRTVRSHWQRLAERSRGTRRAGIVAVYVWRLARRDAAAD